MWNEINQIETIGLKPCRTTWGGACVHPESEGGGEKGGVPHRVVTKDELDAGVAEVADAVEEDDAPLVAHKQVVRGGRALRGRARAHRRRRRGARRGVPHACALFGEGNVRFH